MPAPRVPTFSENYRRAYLTADLPCSVDHGIIGLMDPAHGPFVHQAWWWRKRESIHEKQKNFEPIPNGFRMSAHTPSSNSAPYKILRFYAKADSITTTIDFVLPNLRTEIDRSGKLWFSSRATVTPVRRDFAFLVPAELPADQLLAAQLPAAQLPADQLLTLLVGAARQLLQHDPVAAVAGQVGFERDAVVAA